MTDPLELDPLDHQSPRLATHDIDVRGRNAVVSRQLVIEALVPLPTKNPRMDPLDILKRLAAACEHGAFGEKAPAIVKGARVQRGTDAILVADLTMGKTHPAALRALARMAASATLDRFHAHEQIAVDDASGVQDLDELVRSRYSFTIRGLDGIEEKEHAIVIHLARSAADADKAAIRETVATWAAILEAGAFPGDNAPWSMGFLSDVEETFPTELVARFEFLNTSAVGFFSLASALEVAVTGKPIRALELR